MPTLDFRYYSLVQVLEDDLLLGEPLFFPDVSTVDDDRSRLVEVLGNHVQTALEALHAQEIHRRRAAGAPRTAQIEVELSPPRATIGWREPVTLTVHYVQWEHGEEAHIACVPALGIETVVATARGLEKKLPQDIRAALIRRGVAKSLRKLVELQRIRGIEAVESQVAVKVRSPLEKREKDDAREDSRSALEEVATDLTPSLASRAFEVSQRSHDWPRRCRPSIVPASCWSDPPAWARPRWCTSWRPAAASSGWAGSGPRAARGSWPARRATGCGRSVARRS